MLAPLPPNFLVKHERGGRVWVMRREFPIDAHSDVWDCWLDGEAGAALPVTGGRLPAKLVSLPVVGPTVIRRYHHGGWLAPLTRDLFCGYRRPVIELTVSETLRQRGVVTPQVVAVHARSRAPGLYGAYILTRYVVDGVNLRQWMEGPGRNRPEWGEMIPRVARAIASLHDAGCGHRDLNLSNLLVTPDCVYILDLDGARIADSVSPARRGADLLRLYRSLAKETGSQEPLSLRERLRFLRHYCGGSEALYEEIRLHLLRRWRLNRVRRRASRARSVRS